MNRRGLTETEKSEASRLRYLFEKRKQVLKKQGVSLTQKSLCEVMDKDWTQGAVSSYMSGRIALNLDAAIAFSMALGEPISAFSPRLATRLKAADAGINLETKFDALQKGMLIYVLNPLQIVHQFRPDATTTMNQADTPSQKAWTDKNVSEHAFFADLTDNSMSPEFNVNDKFIIDPEHTPQAGSIVLAITPSGQTLIRKIRIVKVSALGEVLEYDLIPSNTIYPVLNSIAHDLKLVGTAIERRTQLAA